jgi:hypothetical protein
MKTPRTIVVKTLLNADEFLAFEAHCEKEDVSQSKALRDLANGWTRCRNDRRADKKRERPDMGHKRHMSLPSRPVSTGFRMRL